MQATNYFETLVLKTLNGVDALGVPQLYARLFTTSPTETGAGGTEVTYTGYQGVPFSFIAPYLNGGNIQAANADAITWAAPDVDIGEIRFIGITDSAVRGTGNMYLYGELTTPITLRAGQEPTQRAGDIVYYETGNASNSFAEKIFNILRNVTLTGITPYAALMEGLSADGGTELAGTAYARAAITFSAPVQAPSGHAQIQNTSAVTFPVPMGSWGSWGASAIMDSATGGDLITEYPQSVVETITENINVIFKPGDISVSLH